MAQLPNLIPINISSYTGYQELIASIIITRLTTSIIGDDLDAATRMSSSFS